MKADFCQKCGTCRAAEPTPPAPVDRKAIPVCTGVIDYFPDAMRLVARLSKIGNDKHNGPGTPLHWAKEKSKDHEDALVRHLMERGTLDPETGLTHTAAVAWRGLALLQAELEGKA